MSQRAEKVRRKLRRGRAAEDARAEAELNADVAPEFKPLLRQYGLILPWRALTIAEAERQIEELAAAPGAETWERRLALLGLAAAHIKQGDGPHAMRVLDDAASQCRVNFAGIEAIKQTVVHLRLKAKAVQGLLPLKPLFMKDDLCLEKMKIDRDHPAILMCWCHIAYMAGAREAALKAADMVLVAADSVYDIFSDELDERLCRMLAEFVGRLTWEVYQFMLDALSGKADAGDFFLHPPSSGPFAPRPPHEPPIDYLRSVSRIASP